MCGEGEPAGKESFFFFSLLMLLFQSALHTFFVVVMCFNSANEHLQDVQVLGKIKLFMFLKICMGIQNLTCLRRMYYFSRNLDYLLKHLTYSYWTHFSSGNTSCFHLKDGKNNTYCKSYNILFIPKEYISCYTFDLFFFGHMTLQFLNLDNHIFLLVKTCLKRFVFKVK